MSLQQCMTETPYPVFLLWQRWHNEQLNKPDIHCHYMMRIAQRIHQVIRLLCRRDTDSVTLDMQKITWEVPKKTNLSIEQKKEIETEKAKMWLWGLLGGWREK